MSGKTAQTTSEIWDAGDLGCGELVLELRGRLKALPGRVLRLIALDPGAPEDIPAWCRMTGNELIRVDLATSSYWIRGRDAAGGVGFKNSPTGEDIDQIYSPRVFELAKSLPALSRLDAPDVTTTAHSKLCGSKIEIDLIVRDDRVDGYAQRVHACLLGRASAAVVSRAIIGASIDDVRNASNAMRAMLETGAPPPSGRWADLASLAPVRALKSRHPSTLLVFTALDRALAGPSGTAS